MTKLCPTNIIHPSLSLLANAAQLRFFADILLTPLEATRIRMVSQHGYATGLVSGFTRLLREGGVRDLYAGFIPILFK
jgi:solute carrier family 25 (mitochondrial phosphate transporter), member 3